MGAGHSANRPQAGFEVLDVEKEDCTNSDATDATYFKHRDLMVFPKEGTDKHARPIYRRELLDEHGPRDAFVRVSSLHQKKNNGTHRTKFFDVDAPRAAHRAAFLLELDEERHQHQQQAEKEAVEEKGKSDIILNLRGTWTQALAHIFPFFQTSLPVHFSTS